MHATTETLDRLVSLWRYDVPLYAIVDDTFGNREIVAIATLDETSGATIAEVDARLRHVHTHDYHGLRNTCELRAIARELFTTRELRNHVNVIRIS